MKLIAYIILLANYFLLNCTVAQSSDVKQLMAAYPNYLIFTAPVELEKFDPAVLTNAHTRFSFPLLFEPLLHINPQQEVTPVLAYSWKISPDQRSVLINIKTDHRFSDGSPVTAYDVANAMVKLCSPKSNVYGEINGIVGCVEHAKGKNTQPSIKAINRNQISYGININPSAFLYQLTAPSVVVTKSRQGILIGSGAYEIQEQGKGYVVFKKNPYYRGEIIVNNPGVIIKYVSDQALASWVMANKPDGSILYKKSTIDTIHESEYVKIASSPTIAQVLIFNNQKFPFNKKIVRQALSAAIYNEDKISKCQASAVKAYGIVPTGLGGSIANIASMSLPSITSAEVFKEVPKLKKKIVTIYIEQLSGLKNSCESGNIINIAKRFNIKIRFKYHEDHSTFRPALLSHQFDAAVELFAFRNREAYPVLNFFTKSSENFANITSEIPGQLLKKSLEASYSSNKFHYYQLIGKYLQEESIIMPLYYMNHSNAIRKCIQGVTQDYYFNPYLYLPMLYRSKLCNEPG